MHIFLFAFPLAGFAMAEESLTESSGSGLKCKGARCEDQPMQVVGQNCTSGGMRREHVRPHSGEKIRPCTIDQRPVEAKGGHGFGRGGNGGHKVGGAGQVSSASSAPVSNPFTVLRGPIVRLNSVLAAARAHTSPDKEVTSKGREQLRRMRRRVKERRMRCEVGGMSIGFWFYP